jgi:hypothetical protein
MVNCREILPTEVDYNNSPISYYPYDINELQLITRVAGMRSALPRAMLGGDGRGCMCEIGNVSEKGSRFQLQVAGCVALDSTAAGSPVEKPDRIGTHMHTSSTQGLSPSHARPPKKQRSILTLLTRNDARWTRAKGLGRCV